MSRDFRAEMASALVTLGKRRQLVLGTTSNLLKLEEAAGGFDKALSPLLRMGLDWQHEVECGRADADDLDSLRWVLDQAFRMRTDVLNHVQCICINSDALVKKDLYPMS